LALSLSLQLGRYDAATRDTAEMDITFSHQGHAVKLVAGEHISCDGVALPSYGTNFDVKWPAEVVSGHVVTCTYTSGNASATFTFTAPLAPAILSPQEGALVSRSRYTLVSYRISQAWAFYAIALGPSIKAWTPWAAGQPNPVTLDTSGFPPGGGSLALNQFFTLADLRGPAFGSVEGRGGAQYAIQVSWV
jgi:hypothetical protein